MLSRPRHPRAHRPTTTGLLVGLLVLGLTAAGAVGSPAAAAKQRTQVAGWSLAPLSVRTAEVVRVRVDVRRATARSPRTVGLQRRAAGTDSWTTVARSRTNGDGRVAFRVDTSRGFDGQLRLRVAASRASRSLTTQPRRLVVQRHDSVVTPPAPTSDVELEVVRLVNEARRSARSCGDEQYAAARPLRADDRLSQASREHARDMGERGYFDHTSADGRSPWDRAEAAGYDSAGGENIAAGYVTPADVVQGWLDSPGHCANLMSPDMVDIGVGHAVVDGSRYRSYWVQMFGRG